MKWNNEQEMMNWQSNIDITVDEFHVDYHGCGSHAMDIHVLMSYENMETLRDKLSRILEEETYRDDRGSLYRKELKLD